MKLDFTGVQYIKEYKEKLSQEFKKVVGEIEQEVKTLVDCIFYWVKSKKKYENVIRPAGSNANIRLFSSACWQCELIH